MTTPEEVVDGLIDDLVDREGVIEFRDHGGNQAEMIDAEGLKTLYELKQKIAAGTARASNGIHRIIVEGGCE